MKPEGHTERLQDQYGRTRSHWVPARTVPAIPSDTPILGYKTRTANTLRLIVKVARATHDAPLPLGGRGWG